MEDKTDQLRVSPAADLFGRFDVTDEILEAIEDDVGMGCGAWDCVSPKEIIAAAWNRIPKSGPNVPDQATASAKL